MKILLFAAFLSAAPVLAAEPTSTAAKAINALGIDLLRKAEPPDANALLSPYSIQSALAMAYAGADGVTREEMRKVLHFPKDDSEVNRSFAALRTALDEIVQESITNVVQMRQWGLTILRVVVGIVFIAHGAQKLFTFGLPAVVQMFGHMGIPAPSVLAPFVTLLEFVGGILLVVGLFTRWVALLIAIDMLVAILKVHLAGGFFLPRGYEFALTLMAASIALALTGPGAPALDGIIRRRSMHPAP